MADTRPADEVEGVTDILPVTPKTEAKGLLSAIEPDHKVYIQYILCFAMIAAIFKRVQY